MRNDRRPRRRGRGVDSSQFVQHLSLYNMYIYIYVYVSLSLYIYIYVDNTYYYYCYMSLNIYTYNTHMYIYIYIYIYIHVYIHILWREWMTRRRSGFLSGGHAVIRRTSRLQPLGVMGHLLGFCTGLSPLQTQPIEMSETVIYGFAETVIVHCKMTEGHHCICMCYG